MNTQNGKSHGVLVGVDGSPEARAALAWAVTEARSRSCPVTAVGAWLPLAPPPMGSTPGAVDDAGTRESAVAHYIDEAVASIDVTGVDVRREVVMEPAAAALLERADDAELIVIGSRGLGGFGDLLLGSVSRQVATHASCPVVVLRPQDADTDAEAGSEAGRIVVGVDTSRTADAALEFAFHTADRRGVGLTAVHTWEPAYVDATVVGAPAITLFEDIGDEEVRATADVLARWRERFPDVDVRQRVVAGRPAPELIECSGGAELLVVGSRGRGGFVGLLLGSVSHAVLHHARCPVAVVRSHR